MFDYLGSKRRKMSHAGRAALGAVLMTGGTGAVSGAELDSAVETIIVQATRTQIPGFVYPGQVSEIDRETIELTDPASLDALLRRLPGIVAGGGPRRTGQTISARGLGRENVTLLLDGARQNFNSAHDGIAFMDPSLLTSVESVRGPASALYGSGASGGVIAFRTADPADLLPDGQDWGARLRAAYRSLDDQVSVNATLYGAGEVFDGLLGLSRRESGDIRLGSGDDLPADDQSWSQLVKIGADIADGARLELSWQGFDGEAVEPNNGQGNNTVGMLNPLVEKDIQSDIMQLNLDLAPSGLSWIDLNLVAYTGASGVDEAESLSGRRIGRSLENWGVRLDQRFAFSLGAYEAGLIVGGEMYEDSQTGFDSTTADNSRGGVPAAETEFQGVYTQLELTGPAPFGLPGEIVILPGVRHDDFESTSDIGSKNSDSATSGRLGVSYAPADSVVLFASWAEAFRAPSLNEVYLDGAHFSLPHPILGPGVFITNEFIPNPDLRPETTETIEFGVGFNRDGVFRPGDELEVKTSVFRTEAEDLINLTVDFAFNPTCFAPPFFLPCSAGTSDSENIADAVLEGWEASLSYRSGGFSLNGSISETSGQDDVTGEPIGSLQPLRAFLDARYTFEPRRLLVGARAELAGDFEAVTDPAEERDGYAVIDVFARWRPLQNSPLSLEAGVDNLFDEDYSRVFAGVSEAGRSARIGVSWAFGG